MMVKALYENRDCWTYVEAETPRCRETGHAEVGVALAQPAFGPDRR
jgi:hypothetical protein